MKDDLKLLLSDDVYGDYTTEELREMYPDETASDEELWQWLADDVNDTFYNFVENLTTELAVADISYGLWNGTHCGGRIDKLKNIVRDCLQDYNKIYYNNTTHSLRIFATHHDGTNVYDIYLLSAKGKQWYNKHSDDFSMSTIKHLITAKGLTKQIRDKHLGDVL